MVLTPKFEIVARGNISRPPAANKGYLLRKSRLSLIRRIGHITLPVRRY